MARELIPLNEISRKEAARYAQYLTDGDAVAWLYILAGQYSEFTYREKKFPNAVVSAKDGYYLVRNPTPLVRALMRFSIEGESGLVYPGELADDMGEPFDATLDEVRFDEDGKARYQVDPDGNAEIPGFTLAHFSLEMTIQEELPEELSQQEPDLNDQFWDGIRKDNCNIAILTYLRKCADANQTPTPEMCWEAVRESSSNYGEDWMIFPKIRSPNKDTNEVHREKFNRRYAKILAKFNRLN